MNDSLKQENSIVAELQQEERTGTCTHFPIVSVCMPMYNASKYLRECIDSVLAQTFEDFEFLIVDDGSTDESVEIVLSYHDDRIRLIRNNHDYIGSLNLLLDEARGKYIARMDADDVMMPERLQVQYDYMELHSDIDLVASGMNYIGDRMDAYEPSVTNRCLTPKDLLANCCIAHPTVFIRNNVFKKHDLRYRNGYKYAEDYRLWAEMLMSGLRLVNIKCPLIHYRISCSQISCVNSDIQASVSGKIQNELEHWIRAAEEAVAKESYDFPISGNKLTLVIPFLNEGEEVANTVKSAREHVGNNVDIIVINDCSTDGYNYEDDLKGLNVLYVKNRISIGAAASKDKGARLSTTPYFILLDAHMRFYDRHWFNRYIEELEKDDNRILCCQTRWLSKNNGVVKEGNKADTRGAFLRFDDIVLMPGIHWDNYEHNGHLGGDKIPAVLGATYGASKRFWNSIKGLQGLIHYGCEEAYMSIKAYLFGGCCSFLSDASIGHIYREAAPYQMYYEDTVYNNFWIMQTLFPTSLCCHATSKCLQYYPEMTQRLLGRMAEKNEQIQELKSYYLKQQKRDFSYILDINDQFIPEEENEILEKAKMLPDILHFVISDKGREVGVYHGIMGKIVFLCNAFDISKESTIDNHATTLLVHIEKTINNCYCWNFKDGLSGIGWGLIYLFTHNFIDDVEDLLGFIDQRIMCVNVKRIKDDSLDEGIGGILAYAIARLGFCKREGLVMPFDDCFINELRERAALITMQDKVRDYRSHSYASQLQEFDPDNSGWQILRPELWEIFDFPSSINENKANWSISMRNCLGYGLFVLIKIQKLLNIQGIKHEVKLL